ncbi:MAG: sugar ABC transporter permease [Chloroflexi bacterium]|nr:sugar ABC transporter permease [Chloroflexota bacterium]
MLGKFGEVPFLGWVLIFAAAGLLIYWWYRYLVGGKARLRGSVLRLVAVVVTTGLVWLCVSTLTGGGLPGTMVVTLIFVIVGVFFQYTIGLALAMLLVQNLPGKRFFRIVFLCR